MDYKFLRLGSVHICYYNNKPELNQIVDEETKIQFLKISNLLNKIKFWIPAVCDQYGKLKCFEEVMILNFHGKITKMEVITN